jgi:glycosyltransferase involved in cell wall biosynthesis
MSYWTLVTTRNRREDLKRTLESILNQQLPCRRVVVFDDGSSDDTFDLLQTFKREHPSTVRVLHRTDLGYDIKRVVRNWNECLAEAKREGLDRTADFTFISADDCIYPPQYVRVIVEHMNRDPLLAVVSGTRGIPAPLDGWKPPEGSGRLIRNTLLSSVGFRFPEKAGYEPWIVYEAMRRGLQVDSISSLRYEHQGVFGGAHSFAQWGYLPHALGYHPVFFLGRCLQNFCSGKTVPRKAVLGMLGRYLKWYIAKPKDPFYEPHTKELRAFIRSYQESRMKKAVRSLITARPRGEASESPDSSIGE